MNLFRVPANDDAATAARLVDANRAAYQRIAAAGGTLYPVSAPSLDSSQWRMHFGQEYQRLRAAKQMHDPQSLLTPGYEVFTRPGDEMQ